MGLSINSLEGRSYLQTHLSLVAIPWGVPIYREGSSGKPRRLASHECGGTYGSRRCLGRGNKQGFGGDISALGKGKNESHSLGTGFQLHLREKKRVGGSGGELKLSKGGK